jgi:lipoate-protein ligase A
MNRLNKPEEHNHDRPLTLVETSFEDRPLFGTGVSSAVLRRVAGGEIGDTMRLHRSGPVMAFGHVDKLQPGYRRAVAAARAAGMVPLQRLAGGRAAAFCEGTLGFSVTTRESYAPRGTHVRFELMAATIAAALGAIGIDGRVGEVPGEYCPGAYSVNAAGERKLSGIGQRLVAGGAHVGGVLVVRGAGVIRAALTGVYDALGIDWDPATVGSVALELGEDDAPVAGPDPLIDAVSESLRAEVGRRWRLREGELDAETLRLAETLGAGHAVP